LPSVPILSFRYGPDGTTVYVSPPLLEYLGRPLEELQTWAFNDTMHPDDLDRVTREWRANIAAGQPYRMEHRLRTADGSYRWVQVDVLPERDGSGRLIGWYGTVLDIHGAGRSNEYSPFEDAERQRFIDRIPGLVYTMTANCEIELVNGRLREYFGTYFEGVRNWDRVELVHPEDLQHVRESLARTAEFGVPYEVEQRLRRADGEYRWFKSRAIPKRDTQGRVVRWYVLLNDIEDLRRAEEAIRCRGS